MKYRLSTLLRVLVPVEIYDNILHFVRNRTKCAFLRGKRDISSRIGRQMYPFREKNETSFFVTLCGIVKIVLIFDFGNSFGKNSASLFTINSFYDILYFHEISFSPVNLKIDVNKFE